MMEKRILFERYWNLLNLLEDFVTSGTKHHYKTIPDFTNAFELRDIDISISDHAADRLREMTTDISQCKKCQLHLGRNKTVAGEGVLHPLIMIIGEGPGEAEDMTGRPFVGKAGQYLDKWLNAINLGRDKNCYIGNIVKCRPPQNRDPKEEEVSCCLPYLEQQISILKPKIILCVGRISAQILLKKPGISLSSLRGSIYTYKGIKTIVTYHPSAVLRNNQLRKPVWEDLKCLEAIIKEL